MTGPHEAERATSVDEDDPVYDFDLDQFRRDGISWPVGRVDVDGLAEHFFEVQRHAQRRRGRDLHISPHLLSTELDALVRHPTILDRVEAVLGPDFVLWESDFARKPPGGGSHIPWHADGPYWNLSTDEVVSIWVAFTDVSVENAAMQVVPGTHLQAGLATLDYDGDPMAGYAEGIRTSSEGNAFNYDTVLSEAIDFERDAVSIELAPGEFSIHHVDLVHGGGANTSDRDRIGYAMRYISARTYCRTGVDSVMPMRGDVGSEHFVFEPRPTSSFDDAAWAAFEKAMAYPSGFGDRTIEAAEV